jgi:uncharacterized repeat protein (TIGR03843 family)
MGLNERISRQQDILSIIKTVRGLGEGRGAGQACLQDDESVLTTLLKGHMDVEGLMPWSSNYTFLVTLVSSADPASIMAIYKPCQGERPLWDFPGGSLCRREFASYLVSQVLSWPNIPPTVLRNGPHGPGSVQFFVEAEYEAHYFNMRNMPAFTEDFKRMALFDFIVNNADRKGGHCLKSKDGQLWAIDHGLTFHTDFKLRTVIWEFCDETIPTSLLIDLQRLQTALEKLEFSQILGVYINRHEIQAFKDRLKRLLASGCFPEMHGGRNVPFPPI